MNTCKSILIVLTLCVIQIQSIATPIYVPVQHKTVPVTCVESPVTAAQIQKITADIAQIKQDKNPVKKNIHHRRCIQVKKVFITTGEVLWVVTELIVEIIIDNPSILSSF